MTKVKNFILGRISLISKLIYTDPTFERLPRFLNELEYNVNLLTLILEEELMAEEE